MIAAVVALTLAKLRVLAIVAGIVFVLAFIALAAVVMAWVLMAYELASVAVVTEGPARSPRWRAACGAPSGAARAGARWSPG